MGSTPKWLEKYRNSALFFGGMYLELNTPTIITKKNCKNTFPECTNSYLG